MNTTSPRSLPAAGYVGIREYVRDRGSSLMKRLAICLLAVSMIGCGNSEPEAPSSGVGGVEPREPQSACAKAWQQATSISQMEDSHDDYGVTLTQCRTVDEWIEENENHGERLGASASTIVNLCETLGVDATLCGRAAAKVNAARPAPTTPAGPPATPMSEPVELEVEVEPVGTTAKVSGTTNLPDGTELMLAITPPDSPYSTHQDQAKVEDGTFAQQSGHFGNLVPGDEYRVKVLMVVPSAQPSHLQTAFGQEGEHLSGPLVVEGDLGRTVEVYESFTAGS